MQCLTELTPPTAVTHALTLAFLGPDAKNLIVAKTSLLQIYSTKTISEELDVSTKQEDDSMKGVGIKDKRNDDDDGFESSFLIADSALVRAEVKNTTKLVLVAEYALSGTITSMASVNTLKSKTGGDSLLLAFRDARLSLVEWDPARHGLSTISIHYYEQDEMAASPWAPRLSECASYLTVDPAGRCAALRFGSRNLAVIPFQHGDEDTAMDDWDEELDGPRPADQPSKTVTNGHPESDQTLHGSSFVLRLSSLDPSLIYPIHLSFLFEYREPTFGVLSSTLSPSSSLTPARRDYLTYIVFTLDLQQKASTTILAVSGLPCDLCKVVALPPPVGGALLIGENELIHIDQSGKANGIAVNVFAKQSTGFVLADHADLDLRLEDCTIEQLSVDNGEMLLILRNGELCILSFRMDGRSVSGLNIRHVTEEAGGLSLVTGASCTAHLGADRVFVGCENADSSILGWSRASTQSTARRSTFEAADDDMEEMMDDEDDDDLYGDGGTTSMVKNSSQAPVDSTNSRPGDYAFRIHDSLLNVAPIRDITLSRPVRVTEGESKNPSIISSDLELVVATGSDRSGALVTLRREIDPKIIGRFDFQEAQGMWTLSAKRPVAKAMQPDKSQSALDGDYGIGAEFDRLMIVSKSTTEGATESAVYALTDAGFEALTDTEFEPAAGATIEAGTIGKGMRVIQVLKTEVRCYDGDLGLAQILPMFDEETEMETKIVGASLADPFLLLIREDASIFVARCDDDNDLEEIERTDDILLTKKWLSGCLYTDSKCCFTKPETDKGVAEGENVIMFLLSADGALYMYALPNLGTPIFVAEGLCFVPPTLSPDFAARRTATRETLMEIVVADLGDATSRSPYLITRAANDDLTIYEPFHAPAPSSALHVIVPTVLHFSKIHNPHIAKNPQAVVEELSEMDEESRGNPMRAIMNVSGFSCVFMPGSSPCFIMKSSTSTPKVMGLRGSGVRGMSGFHTAGCERGFIYVDMNGIARVSQLPPDSNFTDLGLVVQRISLGHEAHALTYHPPSDTYIISTSTYEEYELPKEDDYHREWQREEITSKPLLERGSVKLMNPTNWSVIDTIELEVGEAVICIKTVDMEISEITHERKQLVAIGTGASNGEDVPMKGRVYIYDVVTVVPEPDRPETDKKLKLIAREEILRGTVTAISEIGSQGFLIIAQGQKCMVRGLKEDGSLLPVAFLDMNTYVTSIKELPGTGLCVFADALKGVWLAGYMEEPYKMTVFGKQTQNMRVVAADLFPMGGDLYILVADDDCNLHVLQYDPEHPKSLHGQILLPRTTFSLGGHLPTRTLLLPRTKAITVLPSTVEGIDAAAEDTIPEHEILITSASGTISLLAPLSEAQYRRLSTLTNILANTLYHACGLNPKAYRISSLAPETVIGGRPIVDGTIMMRWMELGSQKRAEVAGRVGVDVQQVREDLDSLMGGLAYL